MGHEFLNALTYPPKNPKIFFPRFTSKVNGSPVPRVAKPFPVDYLYVTLPFGFDKEPSKTWVKSSLNGVLSQISCASKDNTFKTLSKLKEDDICQDFDILHVMASHDKANLFVILKLGLF